MSTASEFSEPEPSPCPWFEEVQSPTLEQGELLPGFRYAVPAAPYEELELGRAIRSEVVISNVILLTQSCDLEHDKSDQIILCPYFTKDETNLNSENWKAVQKGHRPNFYMIPKCSVPGFESMEQVVSFQLVQSVPLAHLKAYAEANRRRVRLKIPYREDLAQAFGLYVMRIAKPRNYFERTK